MAPAYSPKTSAPNLGGSATGHAQACAADHATAAAMIGQCQQSLVQVGGRWFWAYGPPSDSIGSDGDLFLNASTGDVYAKVDGTWF